MDCEENKQLGLESSKYQNVPSEDKGRLTYFGHIMRADNSLEKIIMQGKMEGKSGTWKTQNKMVGQYSGKSG